MQFECGKYFSESVAVEAHFNFGLDVDTISTDGLDVDIEVKQASSIFVKGDLNISKEFALYGLLGCTKGKLKATLNGFDE